MEPTFRKCSTSFCCFFWTHGNSEVASRKWCFYWFKALDGATALNYADSYKKRKSANVNSTRNNLKTSLYLALLLNHENFYFCFFKMVLFLMPRIKTRELQLKKVWWGNKWLPSKQWLWILNFEITKLNKWWFSCYSNACIM